MKVLKEGTTTFCWERPKGIPIFFVGKFRRYGDTPYFEGYVKKLALYLFIADF